MATIDPTQDYDFISTLTFNTASGNCNILLYRGSERFFSGTAYYRAGTSGSWTSLSVSGFGGGDFPVSNTTMQVANNWNKSGDDYMTQSFRDQTSNLTKIDMSQKAVLSGDIGNRFMFLFAFDCQDLISLDVPDVSDVTSFGQDCFMRFAYQCTSLTSLTIINTESLTSFGIDFMNQYATSCSALERLELPAIGLFAINNVNWSVPSGRLNNLKGYVQNETDLSDWQGVTSSGKTLHRNYVRSTSDVINENASTNNSNFLAFMQ